MISLTEVAASSSIPYGLICGRRQIPAKMMDLARLASLPLSKHISKAVDQFKIVSATARTFTVYRNDVQNMCKAKDRRQS